MPIPASPTGRSDFASAVLRLFHQMHDHVRDDIAGLDDDVLNWVPWQGANTIAVVVTHLLESEAETLRCVAGVACERDRDSEFSQPRQSRAEVLARLDVADHLVSVLAPLITQARLRGMFSLPTLPPDELRPGVTWLVGNYGHAQEHVGQIELTRDLHDTAFPTVPARIYEDGESVPGQLERPPAAKAGVGTDRVTCEWRGGFSAPEVNGLLAQAFGARNPDENERTVRSPVHEHSLGWVVARSEGRLVGFVNVVWDGRLHAWLQDTVVATDVRRHGIGTELVVTARDAARDAGCEWLHVDFADPSGRSTTAPVASIPRVPD